MQPDISKISIKNNLKQIKDFLTEVILSPRKNMIKWSKITNQTPNLKIGYPGQHLASLITGMQGTATGARGQDIIDGTEVKSCSRVDQLDKCEDCKSNVLRLQNTCGLCVSKNIRTQNDSKWLIGIKNEKELDLYLNKIPRILF
ncbi:MamI family restriction endonuclease, partial [Akkermansia sp.]|uniref:MamI family restriction endonuclease n=1 Tax=Akkermansia sp. TaxID=1872421 RepID=UPI003AB2AE23